MARKPRIPPTASLRRRQSERIAKHASSGSIVPHVEQPDVDDPEVEGEEVEEDESTLKIVDSDIDPNSLNGPFPGGPETGAILVDYRHHIAYRVWNGKGDRTLRCRQPTKTMEGWNVHDESTTFKNMVKQSGLWPLVEYSFHAPNRHLISSMVERWHPETNTFHLPFGEMTITLDDVTQIIGIPVMGRAVYGSTSMDIEDAALLVFKSLNLPMNEIHEELRLHNGSALRLNWLRDKLVLKSTSLPEECIHFVVRGFLLFVLGCTLFCDKTGSSVSVSYLKYLGDMEDIASVGWGAATLAHLYRQLGIASRAKCRQISGFLTLLEVWVYEHFAFLSPAPNPQYTEDAPRSNRWTNCRNAPGLPNNSVDIIREILDMTTAEQVEFDPYRSVRERRPLPDYAFFKGCLCVNVIFEPYLPDRVLRQLSHVQCIPRAPIRPRSNVRRHRSATSYRADYPGSVEVLEQWEDNLLGAATRGDRAKMPWDAVPDYLGWFPKISHIILQNPQNKRLFNRGSTSFDLLSRVTTACQFLEDLLDRGSTFTSVQRPILEGMMNFLQHGTPLPHSPVLERRSKHRKHDRRI